MQNTILVVDDEPDIRQSVKMILEVNGYKVITAIDGDVNGGGGIDKFRIKIWTVDEVTGEEIVIYDNLQDSEDGTELNGGSITIHSR